MKRFTTATAKQRFSLLLDAAERGEAVIIERRGVRFRVQPERQAATKKKRRRPIIEIVDPAVAKGVWQWQWRADGLRFSKNLRERGDPSRYQRLDLARGAPSTQRWMGRLYISPANLLEIQFLLEAQRIRLRTNTRIGNLVDDQRWVLDDPPAAA